MFSIELATPIDNNITTVYVGNYTDNGNTLTVNCIVEKDPYREEFITLWSGEIYAKMVGYDESDIANSVRTYYANNRNLVEPIYGTSNGANWDAFNAYMMTDTMFKEYRNAVRAIDGDLNAALFNAYALIERNGVSAFTLVWGQWTQLASITTEDRDTIATVAESFDLPPEFVDVVRG